MTKIDIISGFLGAGKTTLIKKLIKEAYQGEKVVLIENEFGEIGIDGGFLKDAGVQINELNSGCICCSLVGDFRAALSKVIAEMKPDRIVIEPSGVGKLSDVIRAVQGASADGAVLNGFTTVADVNKCKMYIKNFGEFYNDQVKNAGCIVLSHTGRATEAKIAECVALLREQNPNAVIVTTDWDALSGAELLKAMERQDTLQAELERLAAETHHDEDEDEHEHHHHEDGDEKHEHHHDDDCCCGHHHDDDDDDDEEHEHHHDDDEDGHEHAHHHEHHHDDGDDECDCGCGGHHHHHHHHADEVFTSWGKETTKKFTEEEVRNICNNFDEDSETYGMILRAKGIVEATDGRWIHFDYVPGECDIRYGSAGIIGRLCVIGSHLNENALVDLFFTKE
ncbi:MAG: CobW family GTP-binding protein [Eubacteriales bacterium]|nr:CobW family GTP-binding protein [Eubacteriales bacterium]